MNAAVKEFFKNILPFNNRTEMPRALFVIKTFLAFWLCKFVGEIVAEGVVILIHFACGKNVLEGEMFEPQTIMLITYYGYIICIGIALLYWKLIMKKPLSEMGLNKRFGSYFIGAVTGVILLIVSVFAVMLTGGIKFCGVFDDINYKMILLLFGGFVVQGAIEEILCRGIVLHTLKEKLPLWAAVMVSTIVFIIPHLSGIVEQGFKFAVIGIINLILISIIFSLAVVRFKSLWAACGLHTFWNWFLFCIFGLDLSGSGKTANAVFDLRSVGESVLNGGSYGIEESVVTTIILALGAAGFIFIKRK
ncbi:MAG: lysostaphin resistance A-like protein [Oscillospiraceae bacterium]